MVPELKEVYVICDSWTKLNVAPAKIMQVCTRVALIWKFTNILITDYSIANLA